MNIRKQIQILLLLFCLLTTTGLDSFAHQNEWRIEQEGDNGQKLTMVVAEKAVRIEMPSMGFVIICKAPDWTVHCFRNDQKIEWYGPLEVFHAVQLTNPYAAPEKGRGFLPFMPDEKKALAVCGLSTAGYHTRSASYVCSQEIAVDPMVVKFANRLHGSPLLPSVPLIIWHNRRGGNVAPSKKTDWIDTGLTNDWRAGKIMMLHTTKVTKKPFDANDFAIPKGYKRKKDLIEVSYSPAQRLEINDLINNIGFEGNVDKVEKLDKAKKFKERKEANAK